MHQSPSVRRNPRIQPAVQQIRPLRRQRGLERRARRDPGVPFRQLRERPDPREMPGHVDRLPDGDVRRREATGQQVVAVLHRGRKPPLDRRVTFLEPLGLDATGGAGFRRIARMSLSGAWCVSILESAWAAAGPDSCYIFPSDSLPDPANYFNYYHIK